ncbi:MAG: coenzyme F420-0:L-glutamate ligase [bacterium]|nr:coenzyme F420-0:L-glutamate ligase [bacterium]
MRVDAIKTRVFEEGENLPAFVFEHVKKLKEGSILVITSKIVALAQGRVAKIENLRTKDELIKKESEVAIPTKYVWLTVKDGMVMSSAGIDESNAKDGTLILLPKNSYKVAAGLRTALMKMFQLKNLGLLITDSRTAPFRSGVTGVAMGYAGFKGLKSYVGKKDLFGRKFKFSRTNVADNLASAAVLVMGEGNESKPLAVIENCPVVFSEKVFKNELRIDPMVDMYAPLFEHLNRKRRS